LRKRSRSAYIAYLTSPQWKAKRLEALRAANYCCSDCGVKKKRGLHVHHRTYRRLGSERLSDLQVLCASCHMKRHPIKQIRPRAKPKQKDFLYYTLTAAKKPRAKRR